MNASPPTKGTHRLRKPERKRQLLRHAKELFVSLGYQHTTTEKIAHAAGVTEPILYRHFSSKKVLFLEVLEEIRQDILSHWKAEVEGVVDPLDKLQAVVHSYLGSTREHAIELRIMHRTLLESEDPDIAQALRAFYLDSETMLAHILKQGQEAGVFRADFDPRIGAWEFIRTAMGYSMTRSLNIPVYGEPDFLPRAVEMLLRSLRA